MRRRYFAVLFVLALGVSSLTGCEKAEEKAPRLLSDYCSSFFSDSGKYQNGLYIHNPYPDDGSRLNAFQDKDGSFATQLKTLVEGATFWKEVTSFDGNLSFGVFAVDPFFNPLSVINYENCIFTVDLWTDQFLYVQSARSPGLTSDSGCPSYLFHCDRQRMSDFQTFCEARLKEVREDADRGITD
jgi:hypothetical protein